MHKSDTSNVEAALISGWAGAAKFIDRHQSTVMRMVERGTFPGPIYVGDQVAFIRAEVDAWLAARIREREARPTPIRPRADLVRAREAQAKKRRKAA